MKVLHIVYDLMRGGTEGQCARAAMACRRLGHDHRVAVFSRSGFFLSAVEDVCGPVYEIRIRRMISIWTLREILRLKEYLLTEKFDLVHTWDMDAGIFGTLAARLARVPYITSRRNLAEVMPAYKKRLLKTADRGAGAVVVNAKAVADHFIARGLVASKVCMIPNLLDLEEFDRLAAQDVFMPEGRIIGMVCRLEPEKDVGTFIRAAMLLRGDFPDVKFAVVGSGSIGEELKKQAFKEGAGNSLFFLGERTDVPALIKRFHIGVLTPSRNEGLSNSILEYMAAGIPVVATRCGGNEELLVTAGAGLIVQPGDWRSLASALARLLEEPAVAKDMGARGRRKVEADHSPEAVARQFAALYQQAVHSRR